MVNRSESSLIEKCILVHMEPLFFTPIAPHSSVARFYILFYSVKKEEAFTSKQGNLVYIDEESVVRTKLS